MSRVIAKVIGFLELANSVPVSVRRFIMLTYCTGQRVITGTVYSKPHLSFTL